MEQHARVLAVPEEIDGCSLWRVFNPMNELFRQGYKDIDYDLHKNPLLDYLWTYQRWVTENHQYDAVVLPRKHWMIKHQWQANSWFSGLHKLGVMVIYELDDDLFTEHFERRLVEHKGYTPEYAKERRGWIINTIRRCDGMTVSSQRLATMLKQWVDIPIQVVPNYIDLRWFKQVQKRNQRDPKLTGLTVGWFGGWRQRHDLEEMIQAWGILAKKYKHITFVVFGHQPDFVTEYVSADRLYGIPWLPVWGYPAGLLNIDIGCAPLADNTFNRAKTYIKAMEYAASGAAVVASPTVYGQLIEHGEDGYIAHTVEDWVEYLSALIDDYRHRHDMSKKLLAKVRKYHSLEGQAWRWVHAWTELVKAHRQKQNGRILLPEGVKLYA
ncbi:MAG: glycosyltransferase [Planctomycetota bacterium]|jgi:glycosyltransferase involved in cell wall biosynthesis